MIRPTNPPLTISRVCCAPRPAVCRAAATDISAPVLSNALFRRDFPLGIDKRVQNARYNFAIENSGLFEVRHYLESKPAISSVRPDSPSDGTNSGRFRPRAAPGVGHPRPISPFSPRLVGQTGLSFST